MGHPSKMNFEHQWTLKPEASPILNDFRLECLAFFDGNDRSSTSSKIAGQEKCNIILVSNQVSKIHQVRSIGEPAPKIKFCVFVKEFVIWIKRKLLKGLKKRTTDSKRCRVKTEAHNVFWSDVQFESATKGGTGTPSRLRWNSSALNFEFRDNAKAIWPC